MHEIHYMRKYQALANEGKAKPFLCSCGDPYAIALAENFTTLEDGEPEVYFHCLKENYRTPVGQMDMSKAARLVNQYTKE